MLEFFFTNIYGEYEEWNIIASFLEDTKTEKLTEHDQTFLKSLRRSTMSIYEVVDIEPDKSLTVKDMIRGTDPVRILEKSLTRYISVGNCLGLRVLNMKTHLEAAGGCLRLDRSIAEELAPWLLSMRDMVVSDIKVQDTSMSEDHIIHYTEVLWASEIGIAWMNSIVEKISSGNMFQSGNTVKKM